MRIRLDRSPPELRGPDDERFRYEMGALNLAFKDSDTTALRSQSFLSIREQRTTAALAEDSRTASPWVLEVTCEALEALLRPSPTQTDPNYPHANDH